TKKYEGLFYNDHRFTNVRDTLAIEVGLAVSINETPYTVTMQTPGYEKDLVTGLLYAENIYRELNQPLLMATSSIDEEGFITGIDVTIPPELIRKDFAGTRNVISASSCGLCGKTALDECDEPLVNQADQMDPEVIGLMFDRMSEMQKSFQLSGGTHAAGIFSLDGNLISIREDIGRHNAVDKAIGDLLRRQLIHEAKCLTVSGRVSFEIVSKAWAAGIPFLASVSAPSSMAVEYAEKAGMALMAFCRNHKLTVYSNPGRINNPKVESAMASNQPGRNV
ncbi:MAG TPA: formate dehydrogenase accessory sulfurtransferase FdhD, partial [Saprospiraceae bacterium]|nr:formate dehydrogenase accessory sulfurtransferase FdhD [Saprospiraceae bacterium]